MSYKGCSSFHMTYHLLFGGLYCGVAEYTSWLLSGRAILTGIYSLMWGLLLQGAIASLVF